METLAMEAVSPRPSPATTAESTSVTPGEAPAAQPSSSTVQNDVNARVKETPRGKQHTDQLIEILRKTPLKPEQVAPKPKATQEATPAEQPAATPGAEEGTAPEAASVEATPEAEQPVERPAEDTPADETQPTTEEPAPEAVESEYEADGPVRPIASKNAKISLPEQDEVGRLAISFQKRNRDWTLEQAFEAARKQLGINTQEAKADAPTKPALPETVEDVDSKLNELDEAHEKALTDVRFEDAAKLQRQIRQLERHRLSLERQAEVSRVQQEAQYHKAFDNSHAKAVELYPVAADKNSALGKRMLEIESALKANGDPLYHSPDKPLRVAQMAAAELNIAPKRAGQAPAQKAAAAPAQQAQPKKGVVTSGASRTTPPATNPSAKMETDLRAMKPEDFRKFTRQLGVR